MFCVYHPEEFGNPIEAFFLGVMVCVGNILCELTNVLNTMNQKDVKNVITRYVAFKMLI